MKLLFVTNLPSPYRVDFFNELGKHCELTVCYERKSASDRDEKWKGKKAELFKEIYADCKPKGTDQSTGNGIVKILQNERFDHLILTGYSSPAVMRAIFHCKLHRISYHLEFDGGMYKTEPFAKRAVKRFLINQASNILTTCDEHIRYLKDIGIPKNKLHKYPFTSLLNEDIISTAPTKDQKSAICSILGITESKVLLSVGQFIHRKGYDILLNSALKLDSDIGIYIIGGKPTDEYLDFVNKNNLKNVHFIDFMDKTALKQWYLAADVFILPTREDIWGLVINEAMAHGLPVITTDKCNAGLELIENGKNGFTVPIENADAVSKAVCDIFSSDLSAMSNESLKKIRGYTIETMTQAHIDYFRALSQNGD